MQFSTLTIPTKDMSCLTIYKPFTELYKNMIFSYRKEIGQDPYGLKPMVNVENCNFPDIHGYVDTWIEPLIDWLNMKLQEFPQETNIGETQYKRCPIPILVLSYIYNDAEERPHLIYGHHPYIALINIYKDLLNTRVNQRLSPKYRLPIQCKDIIESCELVCICLLNYDRLNQTLILKQLYEDEKLSNQLSTLTSTYYDVFGLGYNEAFLRGSNINMIHSLTDTLNNYLESPIRGWFNNHELLRAYVSEALMVHILDCRGIWCGWNWKYKPNEFADIIRTETMSYLRLIYGIYDSQYSVTSQLTKHLGAFLKYMGLIHDYLDPGIWKTFVPGVYINQEYITAAKKFFDPDLNINSIDTDAVIYEKLVFYMKNVIFSAK